MAKGSNNKILIINGGHVEEEFIKSLVVKDNYYMIIAVDRGLVVADKLKLPLDFIIGDFDSVPANLILKYNNKSASIKTYPTIKDKTDSQIAFELALSHNPTDIIIVGATGSRLDHTIANINLLTMALDMNINVVIMDTFNKIYLKDRSFIIKKEEQHGDFISLIPLSFEVKGLKLSGFKYPLEGITLTKGSSLGISNELLEDQGRVEFEEGLLTVFETRD